ncbi:MAG: pyridoxamine 5'-phosphate oxidase family protein [Nitrospinae bacterium]|nr:pyridoxamine 5'-phosphate oxidase family protein [Nitrospinota bacterium]MCH8313388.1 pyridoxamine 5'-phosphate oxidase family protein [Nitrospinota bacterium]
MAKNFMEFAFNDSVKEVQEKYGTRAPYQKMESKGEFRNKLTWQEKGYIKNRDSFYMSSVGENGWPYLQFRGGPKGFLKVIDENTLAFADFRGNGQYISAGNFNSNKKTVLFLMDYTQQQRLKIWAEVEVFHAADHPELLEKVEMPDYEATIERIFIFKVQAFDWNCPQHITPRYTKEEIEKEMVALDQELIQ